MTGPRDDALRAPMMDERAEIAVLIQARMGSARLPGKVLASLAGVPLLSHVVARCHAAKLPHYVVVCTTDQPEDDAIATHVATLHNVGLHRGPADDVLGRFAGALLAYPHVEVVVRITADDPYKDAALIDRAIEGFLHAWAEPEPVIGSPAYLHLGGITWPLGMDVEVMTRAALCTAALHATEPDDREHVTPWLRRTFGVWTLKDDAARRSINSRWTIDTPHDLAVAQEVYDALYASDPLFGMDALVAWGMP